MTFPDSYPDTTDSEGNTLSLAGQDVQFRIELKDVSELTLTDDSIVNCFGDNKYYTEDGTLVNSVDTFKQYYNELLTKDALGLAIYNYMMDNSVVSEIPQSLLMTSVILTARKSKQALKTWAKPWTNTWKPPIMILRMPCSIATMTALKKA